MSDLYWFVALRRDKSYGRVADKFGLRTWTINLRAWIFGFTCLVFKTTYIDRGKALREDAFFFTRRTLFPPLDKRNTRDKAKGLRITSERYIVGLGARCLSTMSRGQDSVATASTTIALQANDYCFRLAPDRIALPSCRFDGAWRAVCGSGAILRSVAYASIWEPCAGWERARRAEFEYLCLGAYTSVEVVSLGFGDREAPFYRLY